MGAYEVFQKGGSNFFRNYKVGNLEQFLCNGFWWSTRKFVIEEEHRLPT
jgi:hypothetical protein